VEDEDSMIMESVVVLIEDVSTNEMSHSMANESIALQEIGDALAELAAAAVSPTIGLESGPKSYADLFKRGGKKEEGSPVPASAPAKKQAIRAASAGLPPRAKPPAPAAPEAPKPDQGQGKASAGHSLFVKQLPSEITEGDLLRIFAGALKADIHSSKGYGFIEFAEPVFAASTMTRYQEDPSGFSHNGQRLKVEERGGQRAASGIAKGPQGGRGRSERGPAESADNAGASAGGKGQSRQGQGQGQGQGNSGAKKPPRAGEKQGEAGWAVKGSSNKK
jgi:hypothetical protein